MINKLTVFVLNKNKKPLDTTCPARARQLLKSGEAVIYKKYPFTVRLRHLVKSNTKEYRLKIDYGSRYTGLAILQDNNVIWLGQLHHRIDIKKRLDDRRIYRRNRRNRKTRYRKPKFLNRGNKQKGWIPPSLQSRIDNIGNWTNKLIKLCPIKYISYENCKFDSQLMQNPNISGVEYQQGTLMGYEIREYLLEKFHHKCAYCGKEGVPLEIEHIIPKSRGGTNRISNLTIACHECNQKKNNKTAKEFGYPNIQNQAKQSLRDCALVNSTRWKVYEVLKATKLKVKCGTGALTKMNRINIGLLKDHHFDACCTGKSTPNELNFKTDEVLYIKAKGRGSRRRVILNKYGFPRGYYARQKMFYGFMSGDMVKAIVPKGKYKGIWYGQIACRKNGYFDIKNNKGKRIVQGISHKYYKILQRFDGYSYERREIDMYNSSRS